MGRPSDLDNEMMGALGSAPRTRQHALDLTFVEWLHVVRLAGAAVALWSLLTSIVGALLWMLFAG